MKRVAALALRFNRASKARFFLMALITAGAIAVFLIVAELSRTSSYGLNQSIAVEAGQTGTYDVDFSTMSGMDPQALASLVTPVLQRYGTQPPVLIEIVPQIPLDCPPDQTLGSVSLLFERDTDGRLLDLPAGDPLSGADSVCLGGEQISSSAVLQPTQSELFDWLGVPPGEPSPAVIVAGTFERLALLTATEPTDLTFAIVTGQQQDESVRIKQALDQAFEPIAATYGQAPTFQIERRDTFQAVRQAASGVDLVYSIIAWGVLALGALGLLVAEIIIVRDRSWFFGLARAVGARGVHIGTLVVIDILFVLAAGTALALLLVLALQPVAASFARSTFQVTGVRFLRLSTLPQLILGDMAILLMAGLYPALRAIRQDPLDVLEPRVA